MRITSTSRTIENTAIEDIVGRYRMAYILCHATNYLIFYFNEMKKRYSLSCEKRHKYAVLFYALRGGLRNDKIIIIIEYIFI